MTVESGEGVPALLGASMTVGAGRGLLTYYDDKSGERTDLSAVELGDWAARTANLLAQGCQLGPGAHAAAALRPHWQSAAVLLGAWSAGLSVAYHLLATAGLPPVGRQPDYDVTFASADRIDNWLDDVPEAAHRFALGLTEPLSTVPEGYRDYLSEVRQQGVQFRPDPSMRRTDPATPDGTTFEEWGRLAREIATMLDLRRGDRVLIDAGETEHPLRWLLAPLSAGASVVLCANLDPAAVAARVTAEGVTRVM